MTNNSLLNLLLVFIGGILFSLGWEPLNFIIGPMIGLLPLLAVEAKCSAYGKKWRKWKVFGTSYLFFATFNAATIWWVWNASWIGVVSSVVVNSLFFALIFTLFSSVKKYLGDKVGYLSLLIFWIGWEYIELLDWDLSWPWMTLGFSLAGFPKLIQWYEYSGSLGGSLWLLLINLMVLFFWNQYKLQKSSFYTFKRFLYIFYVIIPPIAISLFIYWMHEPSNKTADVVVLQPNKEPYEGFLMNEKGEDINVYGNERSNYYIRRIDTLVNDEVKMIFFPETSFPDRFWNMDFKSSQNIQNLKYWLINYPNSKIVMGVNYYQHFTPCTKESMPFDASLTVSGECFKRYNSAIVLSKDSVEEIYHKSRLVIGVERIPSYFIFLQKFLEDFENQENVNFYNPNNAIQEEREVFYSVDSSVVAAPIICYESIFGEYVTEYVQKGANLLSVVTNDAWWGDTPGYKQHWSYARLRAIECRRSVARSANTGKSGFINEFGEDIQVSEYYIPTALKGTVTLNDEKTFYVEYGDILGRICVLISFAFILNLIVRIVRKDAIV